MCQNLNNSGKPTAAYHLFNWYVSLQIVQYGINHNLYHLLRKADSGGGLDPSMLYGIGENLDGNLKKIIFLENHIHI